MLIENKVESDPFLETLKSLEILGILEIPPVKCRHVLK